MRHRFQGWVALQAIDAEYAAVVTRSVIAPMNATATLNLGGAGPKRCAVVELLDPHHPHVPIAAYAGDAAARVCEDSVEAALRWGAAGQAQLKELPALASEAGGVVFRIRLAKGLRLFGLTLWV